ncbi:MAG: peptidase MA family metallohydrolase [Chloroflexota bacterium]
MRVAMLAGGLAFGWAAVLPLVGASSVAAADPTFGTPTMEASFERGIQATQPVTLDAVPYRVELLLSTTDVGGPLVIEVPPPPRAGATTLRYTVGSADGHTLPNTPISVRWRITPIRGGPTVTSPAARTVYEDDRFAWQTVTGDVVRVHWYEGSRAFAERALRIGEEAVKETAALLGVTEDEPVDFFIYADQTAFYDALGPGTRENVGGQANAGIRTLFALIGPADIDDPWVGIVIPHELVHLVFDTAVRNPYHFPPRWLNEGLAVYLSQGYDRSDRTTVETAARRGTLIPLDGLGGQFPTTRDGFFLAYAESVSAVDFFIRTHDRDALVRLIRSYADGRTDDEAFTAAIGVDVVAFDAAWLADLGADPPVRYGPQPAPRGPQPAAWAQDPPPGPGATGVPGPTAGGATSPPSAPSGGADDAGGSTALAIAIGVVLIAGAVLVVARRRPGARAAPPPPPDSPDSPGSVAP